MHKTITRAELYARLQSHNRPVVLEALPERYYLEAHLPGALNVPHDRVRELAPALLADRDAEIVTYCASKTCRNSHLAADALRAMGYANVSVYAEGKQDWIEAGLPVEKGPSAQQAA